MQEPSITWTVHSLVLLLRVMLAKELNESAAPALRLSKLNYLSLERRKNAGTGHKSLSIFFHYVQMNMVFRFSFSF